MTDRMKYALSGAAAGAVNGPVRRGRRYGAGPGPDRLVPYGAETGAGHLRGSHPAFVPAVGGHQPVAAAAGLDAALPYLLGGLGGGFVGGRLFQKVSNLWLRRIFACFLLYGGVRYLL